MARSILLMIALAAPPVAAIVGAEFRERQRYPRRFAEVIPQEVYRGGFPTADDVTHLKQDLSIRTLINLTERTDRPEEKEMLRAAEHLGLQLRRFPMPGDGRGDYAMLEKAADAIAEATNRPVFFHCAAGKQRSNAAWGAYRIKHCGWDIERTLAELERDYDLDRHAERLLCEHLTGFARWMSTRTAASSGPAEQVR
jgi:protein tyrosine phosphatase (PTP) superfamily phosphohydrolase (DUF442 family)